jgi:hypothetical protein
MNLNRSNPHSASVRFNGPQLPTAADAQQLFQTYSPLDTLALAAIDLVRRADEHELGEGAHGPQGLHTKVAGRLGKTLPNINALNRMIGALAGAKRAGDGNAGQQLELLRGHLAAHLNQPHPLPRFVNDSGFEIQA